MSAGTAHRTQENPPYDLWYILKDASPEQSNGRDAWGRAGGKAFRASLPSSGTLASQRLGVLTHLEACRTPQFGVLWSFSWLWVIELNPQLLFLPRCLGRGRGAVLEVPNF